MDLNDYIWYEFSTAQILFWNVLLHLSQNYSSLILFQQHRIELKTPYCPYYYSGKTTKMWKNADVPTLDTLIDKVNDTSEMDILTERLREENLEKNENHWKPFMTGWSK